MKTPRFFLVLALLTSATFRDGIAGIVPVTKAGPSPLVLTIGNDQYEKAFPLQNCKGDALAIARIFCSAGGTAMESTNLSGAEINTKVTDWVKQGQKQVPAKEGNLAVLYYAGHSAFDAASESGRLFGIDVENPEDIDPGNVPVAEVIGAAASLAKGGWHGILVFDCDLPFRDLPVPPPGWAFLFAAQPSKHALDGKGNHSPLAQALINCMNGSALTSRDGKTVRLNAALAAVCQQVAFSTEKEQVPILVANQFDAILKVIPPNDTEIRSEAKSR